MKYVIAIDISLSSSGVAIFSQDGKIKKLLTVETDSKSDTQIRLKKIADEMNKIKKEYSPSVVVLEQGFSRFNISTQQLFRCHGLINYLFWDVEQVYYHSTTVRKVVYGKGNIKKEILRDYILEKYKDIEFRNLDESDAVGVGLCFFKDKGILI